MGGTEAGMGGGASRCWVFADEELSAVAVDRNRLLVRVFGPDVREIPGTAGGTSMTSNVVSALPWLLPIALPDGVIA